MSCLCIEVHHFQTHPRSETLTKPPSFRINIIYANRSIKGTLTCHLTWPHYVTHHVISIMDVQRAHVKFDPVTLTWPGDPRLTSAYKRRHTMQISCLYTELCCFHTFFNSETLTKLPSFKINISIYANRSNKGTLTFHLTWPHYVTLYVTLIIDV